MLGPTSTRKGARQTIIENRIKKRNETDSCRKDFLIERLEGLSEKWEKTILHLSPQGLGWKAVIKGQLFMTTQTIICEAQARSES